jgi:hypothetical protein
MVERHSAARSGVVSPGSMIVSTPISGQTRSLSSKYSTTAISCAVSSAISCSSAAAVP